MKLARTQVRWFAGGALVALLVLQAALFARPIHSGASYDEGVYLAAVDALRHGQSLGSQVFAAQFPGFYDLLRGISFITGIGVVAIRWGMLGVTLLGSVGGFLVGRRFAGNAGGLLAAAFLIIAPPLDLFGWQVLADGPTLALTLLALGLATLPGTVAAVAAGAVFGAAFTVKITALTALPTMVWLLRRRSLLGTASFLVVVCLELLAHAGALGSLWQSGVRYHEKARSTPAVIPHPHHQIVSQIPHATPFFWLAIAAGVLAVGFFARRRPLGTGPLWVWVGLSVVFLLVQKPLHENHLINFPFPLAVASGATIGAAALRAPARVRMTLFPALALVITAAYVQQWHRVQLAKTPEPASNVAAARALTRLTDPGDHTVDDRPIISFLAHRRVYGPLVDLALLRFETRSVTDDEVIAGLRRSQAAVVSRSLRTRPRVLTYLRSDYTLRYRAGGVAIYTRKDH
jgi:hypothetical protein